MTRTAAKRIAGSGDADHRREIGTGRAQQLAPRAPAGSTPACRTHRAPRAPTRGLSSRAAVRSAVSTSIGTGRGPSASGPPRTPPRRQSGCGPRSPAPTFFCGTIFSARKMFSSAAIASNCTSSSGSVTSAASGTAASGYAASFSSCDRAQPRRRVSRLARSRDRLLEGDLERRGRRRREQRQAGDSGGHAGNIVQKPRQQRSFRRQPFHPS